jgi:hypothetical protein
MTDTVRPLPGHATVVAVAEPLNAGTGDWILAGPGACRITAVEAIHADGTAPEPVVALEWLGVRHGTNDPATARLLLSPDAAIAAIEDLARTAVLLKTVGL